MDMKRDERPCTYAFPLQDDKVSVKKPPGPCFVCGSQKHWKRECPHLGAYEEAWKAGWLKESYIHAVDKEYETQEQEYLLEMVDAEMEGNETQAF
jgi:hypothetical protein